MKRIRKLWKTAALLLLTAAFLVSVRNIKPYVVLSGSMEPVLPVGSVVVIDQSQTAVQAGDIAAFLKNGQTVTHRIVEVTEKGYITKGDANSEKDTGIVAPQKILGKVILCVPDLGFAVLWIQQYKILILGTVVFLWLLAFLFLGSGKGKTRSDDKPVNNEKGELKL